MGVMPDAEYTKHEVSLKKGDCIFLYTDGVSEAENEDETQYGEERLLQCLTDICGSIDIADRNEYCKEVCKKVVEDVLDYSSGREQFDDITSLCIRYLEENSSNGDTKTEC